MTGRHDGGRPDNGFLVVEAGVAIAMITVVMTAVTAYFVVTMRVTRQQQEAQVAAQIATSGLTTVRSMPGSALIHGRDKASSHTQWNAQTSAITPYLGSSTEAWDDDAAPGSGPHAALPTTPVDTTVEGLNYRTSWYIGSCSQPAAGGPCTTQTSAPVPMYRVVVAVTWTDAVCPGSTCTYAVAALASNAPSDPVFNVN